MGRRALILICAVLPACSFVFVKEPNEAARKDVSIPLNCTQSSVLPIADFLIGAVMGGLIAATTYTFIEEAAEDCPVPGACQRGTGPAILTGFLVVSPWWISSAVGFSDTGRCRSVYRARALSEPGR